MFTSVTIPKEETDKQLINRALSAKTGLTGSTKALAWVNHITSGCVFRYYHITIPIGSYPRYNKDKKFKWVNLEDLLLQMLPLAPSNIADLIAELLIMRNKAIKTLD